jgi:vacuolar-type H+-ATPase subunit I/STV1
MAGGLAAGAMKMDDDAVERDAIGEALLRRQRGAQSPGGAGFMDRQRDALQDQVSAAMKQIEQLRLRHEQLAHEKTEVEALLRRQSEYLTAKNLLIGQFRDDVAALALREERTGRLLELVREAHASFAKALDRLEQIDEDTWADRSFESELANAAALVAEARGMRDRLAAQIEAASWRGAEGSARTVQPGSAVDGEQLRTWALRGLAFGAPVVGLALLAYILVKILS